MDDKNADAASPRYRWPWFVLAAVILGVVLAIAWMSVAVHRIREQRIAYPPAAPTTESNTMR
jgi:hypothetical protein